MTHYNKRESAGYNDIMASVRMGDFHDPWGTVMGWLFAIAEVAYKRFGELLPAYRPSYILDGMTYRAWVDQLDDSETTEILGLVLSGFVDFDDLERSYEILGRYADWVELAGRSY